MFSSDNKGASQGGASNCSCCEGFIRGFQAAREGRYGYAQMTKRLGIDCKVKKAFLRFIDATGPGGAEAFFFH